MAQSVRCGVMQSAAVTCARINARAPRAFKLYGTPHRSGAVGSTEPGLTGASYCALTKLRRSFQTPLQVFVFAAKPCEKARLSA